MKTLIESSIQEKYAGGRFRDVKIIRFRYEEAGEIKKDEIHLEIPKDLNKIAVNLFIVEQINIKLQSIHGG
jgi:hypothetical protein